MPERSKRNVFPNNLSPSIRYYTEEGYWFLVLLRLLNNGEESPIIIILLLFLWTTESVQVNTVRSFWNRLHSSFRSIFSSSFLLLSVCSKALFVVPLNMHVFRTVWTINTVLLPLSSVRRRRTRWRDHLLLFRLPASVEFPIPGKCVLHSPSNNNYYSDSYSPNQLHQWLNWTETLLQLSVRSTSSLFGSGLHVKLNGFLVSPLLANTDPLIGEPCLA